MDLRSIINNEGAGGGGGRAAATAGGGDNSKHLQTPATPVQASPQQYREYGQAPSHGSKHPSQDYGQNGQSHYASPIAYQNATQQRRTSLPQTIQPVQSNDSRSSGASQYPAQSPYRQPASGSTSGAYPFPQNATPQSPAQPNLYQNAVPHRESHQSNGQQPPQLQHQNSSHQSSYGQPSPHTPTIGTPGQQSQYHSHQRSSSSQSTSTPTSAQSQPHNYHQYPTHPHDSPVLSTTYPPQGHPHQRQQSQPGTPLGPPVSIPRQQSGSFQHPTSPYQQRPPSSGIVQPYPAARASPSLSQSSHHIPLSTLQRQASTPNTYESRRGSIEEHQRRSQSSRERSLSVSPKTQIYSIPRGDIPTQQQFQQVQQSSLTTPEIYSPNTSSKRKMGDRESSEPAPHRHMPNGLHENTQLVSSPHQPVKKRIRYTDPPIWAQSILRHKKAVPQPKGAANGVRPHQPIQQHSGNGQLSAAFQQSTVAQQPIDAHNFDGPLGTWEQSITGHIPLQEMAKSVADWLYMNVVSRQDAGELKSRGVEIEIEAKLGRLIDQDTHQRVYYPVKTECILEPTNRLTFQSSMTEIQHKQMNDYLNARVVDADPRNPNQTKPRVKIDYKHRRERDVFHDLPQAELALLPAAIRDLTKRYGAKVRITYDQKTNEELARIIKARVNDLSIYFPSLPLDCRISVNLEMKYDGDVGAATVPPGGDSRPDRLKDRLSYSQGHYQIDLTQVTTVEPGIREKEHELEVELNAESVVDQGLRAARGEPHGYPELVEGFVNNIRVLARAVPP